MGQQSVPTKVGQQSVPTKMGQQSVPTKMGQQSVSTKMGQHSVPTKMGQHSVPTKMGQHSVPSHVPIIGVLQTQKSPHVVMATRWYPDPHRRHHIPGKPPPLLGLLLSHVPLEPKPQFPVTTSLIRLQTEIADHQTMSITTTTSLQQ